MTEVYNDGRAVVYNGDCVAVLASMPDNSVDAVVTDPPYGLGFMGKKWDTPQMLGQIAEGDEVRGAFAYGGTHTRGYADNDNQKFQAWSTVWAGEVLRVLKPGGHLVAFGGTRTWHRLTSAIEDAGFEIRDSLAWLYGSGFPKGVNVSKAIDKAAGKRGEKVGERTFGVTSTGQGSGWNTNHVAATGKQDVYAPATPESARWEGWNTALKPAFEPIVLARKPLAEKTVAKNVLEHGTGAINVDACRVGDGGGTTKGNPPKEESNGIYGNGINGACDIVDIGKGRWPANVVLDEHAAAWIDEQSGTLKGRVGMTKHGSGTNTVYGTYARSEQSTVIDGTPDSGGASRFFYCAKASKKERPEVDGIKHPTVKPLALMRWLVRLVTPGGGTVLDPFAGSGTTLEAALGEGFNTIGIESEQDYVPLILARINNNVKD